MRKTARRLAGVITAAGSRYLSSGASDLAAGIAYRVLFALAPLTVALVSVFGLLLQNEELKHDVIDRIVSALPVNSQNVTGAIGNIATPASAAGLVSLLVLVWAASGMMTAIRFGLERTMSVEEDRGVVHGKLVDLGLVAATVVLVLASVGVGLVTQVVSGLVAEVVGAVGLQETATTTVVTKLLQLLLWTGTVLLSSASCRRSGHRGRTLSPAPWSLHCCCWSISRGRLSVFARDQVELHLRLLDERVRVPVLGLPVRVSGAVRCGCRDGMVFTSPAGSRIPFRQGAPQDSRTPVPACAVAVGRVRRWEANLSQPWPPRPAPARCGSRAAFALSSGEPRPVSASGAVTASAADDRPRPAAGLERPSHPHLAHGSATSG